MEKWIIVWKNGLDYPCAMPEDDGGGIASYDSLDKARLAWNEYGVSGVFGALAVDLNGGDVESL